MNMKNGSEHENEHENENEKGMFTEDPVGRRAGAGGPSYGVCSSSRLTTISYYDSRRE